MIQTMFGGRPAPERTAGAAAAVERNRLRNMGPFYTMANEPTMRRRDFIFTPAGLFLAPGFSSAQQSPLRLRFRQVHLDFHTSEAVRDIAASFDPEEFAATVERARVNSITCFARCHHGWIYYDSSKNPERRHPYLKRNLLKEQIDACHKRGIRVPIYVTIQWDHYSAQRHPEWLVIDDKGAPRGTPIFEPGFYRFLCVNTAYRQFIAAHVAEICDTLPVDGLFFDIVQPVECSCLNCRTDMRKRYLDPTDGEARRVYAVQMINAWKREMTALVHMRHKDATVFYNAGHIGPRHRAVADAYTHWELESLPSGGWGYLDFPLKVRYTRTMSLPSLGMTGKFHTSWGDFQSYKTREALEFECFQMLALGAQCSVGDQLHPSGKIDAKTYELIGAVYSQVEKKEPWCAGARQVADVGVLTPEEFLGAAARQIPPAAFGAVRLLTEAACQFDVLDSKSDFSRYKLLILPDTIPAAGDLGAKIDAYVKAGGAVLASCESGGFSSSGVKILRDAPFSPDFLVPEGPLAADIGAAEYVMYQKGKEVEALAGTQVLAWTNVPYFNRAWDHFFSHRHTPSSGKRGYPGVTRNGKVIYFMHPVFGQYHANAPKWVKAMVVNAIRQLLPEPVLELKVPSTTIAALNEQPAQNRWVLHLLHYIPERRGTAFDVIQDVIPIHDVQIALRPPKQVRRVITAPEGQALSFTTGEMVLRFTLPKLTGHQIIAIEFA